MGRSAICRDRKAISQIVEVKDKMDEAPKGDRSVTGGSRSVRLSYGMGVSSAGEYFCLRRNRLNAG